MISRLLSLKQTPERIGSPKPNIARLQEKERMELLRARLISSKRMGKTRHARPRLAGIHSPTPPIIIIHTLI
jgi:hypothetical protein